MEREIHTPDWVAIEPALEVFSIGDDFGKQCMLLVEELKMRNQDSVWAKRLALYETARRKAWLHSFLSLSESTRDSIMYPRFTVQAIQKLMTPARAIQWESLFEEIKGKNVILEHGSYRSVPTMAHVGYVNYGFVSRPVDTLNVVSLDARQVIKDIKGQQTIVLHDELRKKFWQHVPGVDIVVITPEFDARKVRKFWVENTYLQLSKTSKHLTLLSSYGDQIAREKRDYAQLIGNIDVHMVFRDSWHREFGGNSSYVQWTTSDWDRASEDYLEFEQLALQFLNLS